VPVGPTASEAARTRGRNSVVGSTRHGWGRWHHQQRQQHHLSIPATRRPRAGTPAVAVAQSPIVERLPGPGCRASSTSSSRSPPGRRRAKDSPFPRPRQMERVNSLRHRALRAAPPLRRPRAAVAADAPAQRLRASRR